MMGLKLTQRELSAVIAQDGYNVQYDTGESSRGLYEVEGDSSATGNRQNKYNAQKCELDGHVFDSLAERGRYAVLKTLSEIGLISELRLQPRYRLQDAFTDDYGRRHRAIDYVADFEYVKDGQTVCEDVKGGRATATPVYRIKAKLAIRKYPHIHFREVGT